MSTVPRMILGVALILIALGFFALVPLFSAAGDAFPAGTIYFLGGMAILCGLGALACFAKGSHPVTIRVLGAVIFATSLWYMASQATAPAAPAPNQAQAADAPPEFRFQRRGRPSFVNSLLFFGLIGLPSAYAAATGRYPAWGMGGPAFSKPESDRRTRSRIDRR